MLYSRGQAGNTSKFFTKPEILFSRIPIKLNANNRVTYT